MTPYEAVISVLTLLLVIIGIMTIALMAFQAGRKNDLFLFSTIILPTYEPKYSVF